MKNIDLKISVEDGEVVIRTEVISQLLERALLSAIDKKIKVALDTDDTLHATIIDAIQKVVGNKEFIQQLVLNRLEE